MDGEEPHHDKEDNDADGQNCAITQVDESPPSDEVEELGEKEVGEQCSAAKSEEDTDGAKTEMKEEEEVEVKGEVKAEDTHDSGWWSLSDSMIGYPPHSAPRPTAPRTPPAR